MTHPSFVTRLLLVVFLSSVVFSASYADDPAKKKAEQPAATKADVKKVAETKAAEKEPAKATEKTPAQKRAAKKAG